MKNTAIKKVKHMAMVRDLGGLHTLSGEIIRYNVLFRTSRMSKIKNKQENKIKNTYNVSTVIDLRTEEELIAFPDVKIDEITYCNYPVLSDFDNPVVKRGNLNSNFKKIMNYEGGSMGYLLNCYRKLVTSELAIENYRKVIIEIANSKDSLIYHCTQGKDRTGVATVLLLLILGVSEEDIIEDYLKYNKVGKIKRVFIYIGISLLKLSIKAAKEIKNLLIARREYIEEVFKTIKSEFISIDNYIKNILKIDEETILKLKKKFLVKKL